MIRHNFGVSYTTVRQYHTVRKSTLQQNSTSNITVSSTALTASVSTLSVTAATSILYTLNTNCTPCGLYISYV